MDWLIPAAVANLAGTSIMTLVFLYLYAGERQRFLGVWATSWGIYGMRFIFLLWQVLGGEHPLLVMGYQLASLMSGVLLLWGTYIFMKRSMSRLWLVATALAILWILIAVWRGYSFVLLTAPTFLFLSVIYIWTGIAFLNYEGFTGVGKTVTGWCFILWGVHKAGYPFLQPILWFAPWGYLLGAILELLITLGTLIFYFHLTKEELRKREAHFRAIFEKAALGIGLINPQGRYIQVNQRLSGMLGYSPEELSQKTNLEITHPDDIDLTQGKLGSLFAGEVDDLQIEKRFLRKDGSAFWADQAFSTVRKPTGEIDTIISTLADMTQRKQVEQALEIKTRQQEKLIETARRLPESLELDQVLKQIASSARQIIDGYGTIIFIIKDDGLTLVPAVALHPIYEEEIMSTQIRVDNSLTGQAVKTGRGLIFNNPAIYSAGYFILGTDDLPDENVIVAPLIVGERTLGAIWLNRIGIPFSQEDLTLVETFASFAATAIKNAQAHENLQKEIEERKQAEEALRAMEDRFRIAFRTSPDSININRLSDGLYVDINDGFTALTGYTREDVRDKTSLEINIWHDPLDRDRLTAGLRQDGVVRNLEAKFRLKDGCLRTGLMSATLLHLNGEPHILSITRDIEERKAAELALMESEERYRSLFENNHTVMWIVDPADGRIVDANPAACNFYGYPKEELTCKTVMDMNSLNAQEVYSQIQQAERDERNHFLRTHRLSSGEERLVEVYTGPIKLEGESRLYTIIHDVTERVQREREMEAILKVATTLRIAPTRAEMFPVILQQVLELLQAEEATLALYDPITGEPALENKAGKMLKKSRSARYFAGIPLVWQEKTIGALSIHRSSSISPTDIRILSAIGEIAANALQRASLFEETQRNLERLNALHTIDIAITDISDLEETLGTILEQITGQLHVDAVDILLLDMSSQLLHCVASHGFIERPDGSSLNLWDSRAGQAILDKHLVSITGCSERDDDLFHAAVLPQARQYPVYFAAPLIAKDQTKGVLELYRRADFAPDNDWLGFLDTLARQTAIALDNATLFEDLQSSNAELTHAYDTTLEGWARALELRDKETEGHTQRVVKMTLGLARRMGIDEDELLHVRRGALLHDIGKMGIPDIILFKPGPLTKEEWAMMRKHPVFAYELLSGIPYLRAAMDVPYCHHEKWDGSGYPRGLAGDQIPLAARIFAVVDVWDALNSDRPYRNAWPRQQIEAYIREQAGKHFDPSVVQAFFDYLKTLKPTKT